MVSRVYVEKKPGFDVEAQQLLHELRTILGVEGLENLRLINRYDVSGITQELFDQCVPTVFSEPFVDVAQTELPCVDGAFVSSRWNFFLVSLISVRNRQASAFSLLAKGNVLRSEALRCMCLKVLFRKKIVLLLNIM